MAGETKLSTCKQFRRAAWLWLGSELDAWSAADKKASLWWRDDDAVDNSDQLEQLIATSLRYQVPLSLAVIPSRLKPDLARRIKTESLISVLQHGYAHINHAIAGEKKRELSKHADQRQLQSDLAQGYRLLEQAFGDQFNAVLVPPWNRIDDEVLELLVSIGYRGISAMKARKKASPVGRILQVNTHLDPIHWRHHGGFIGSYPAIAMLVQHLQARRLGYRDIDEPTGLLSHHLVQNQASWRFIEELLQFFNQHPAAEWLDSRAIWT